MGGDDEFDDFLRKRRRLFGPAPDDDLEPPAEVDRLVLRRAREAIETPRPQRMFRAPPWSMPVALAATLVLAFTVILHTARTPQTAQVADVSVDNVARRVDADAAPMGNAPVPAAPAAMSPMAAASAPAEAAARAEFQAPAEPANGAFVVDLSRDRSLVSEQEAKRYVAPPPPAPSPALARNGGAAAPADKITALKSESDVASASASATAAAPAPAAKASPNAPWRRDSKTWLAEIEKLRASGDTTRANAELAEFKRTYGAYAAGPDR